MLQNRTYLGKIKYQRYKRKSDGSRSYEHPVEWHDFQHEAVIDTELFEKCQEERAGRRAHRRATKRFNPYLLRNLFFCWRCCQNPPEGKMFRNYGKMRPQSQSRGTQRYYRCRARELGYQCDQPGVPVEEIDDQVVGILMSLQPPEDWRRGVTRAVGELLGEQDLQERLADIHAVIKRMDKRWDNGFITDEQEYIQQRLALRMEPEQLTPVTDDELERAADIMANFATHWRSCEGKPEEQHDLVKLIVQRVYVEGRKVKALTLRSNYHIVLGHKLKGPTYYEVDPFLYTHGSDGLWARGWIETLLVLPPWAVGKQRYRRPSACETLFPASSITLQEGHTSFVS